MLETNVWSCLECSFWSHSYFNMQKMKLQFQHQYKLNELVSVSQHFDVKPTQIHGIVTVPDLIFTPQLRRF